MEEYLTTLTIIAIVFIVGFLLGFKQGCKFMWKKILNYLQNKGKSDIEIGNVFVELSKSKYGNN
jgi:hypothetical protein